MDLEVLEARVRLGLGRHARDVELVVDVDVRLVALGADRRDRLASRARARSARAAASARRRRRRRRPGSRSTGSRRPGRREHAAQRLHHAAGDDDHVQARVARAGERRAACAAAARRRARSACGRDPSRRRRRRAESRPGARSAAAARCLDDVGRDVRDLLRRQLALERRHRALAVDEAVDGEREVRLRVVEVRADRARRAGVARACGTRAQPFAAKIALPAAASPFAYSGGTVGFGADGTFPTTVSGVGGRTSPPGTPQQAAPTSASTASSESGSDVGARPPSLARPAPGTMAAHETSHLWP